ncbi:hypothetical protein CPC08DRAFT_823925 [Agrocybe pediades]|nr:hypothetical protein CPC08DRAFT_823925 [Agrocybe pediades]
MVRALQAFLEFCYLVRRAQIDEDVLMQIDSALERFHREREVFIETGIREDFLLPRQHSMMHYRALIQMFSAPNGLCTSITESKHIKAVKEPWRRSNRNNPLGQMLLTNQRQDKLAAAQVYFESRGWLWPTGTTLGDARNHRRDTDDASSDGEGDDEDEMEGIRDTGDVKLAVCPARGYPSALQLLAQHISLSDLHDQIRRFLFDQTNPDSEVFGMDAELDECPEIDPMLHIKVFHSAISTYHAPSDLSGIGGMHSERIRATPSWQKQGPRYDCIFVNKDTEVDGFKGLLTAQVALLFSFSYLDKTYPCAYVRWFSSDDNVCPSTGMWTVRPELSHETGQRVTSVIHLGSVLRSAHLIPVYGTRPIPRNLTLSDSLYAFKSYYINKYSDYHAHEIAF